MANMKVVFLLASILLCCLATVVRSEDAPAPVEQQKDEVVADEEQVEDTEEKKDEKADPRKMVYSYSYSSKPVVSHSYSYTTHTVSKPVVTSHVTSHVGHGHSSRGSTCPSHHPFAYYNGKYCCQYGQEKTYKPQGSKCDSSVIGFNSLCCQSDKYVKCPRGICKNYGGKKYLTASSGGSCYVEFYQHDKYNGRRTRFTSSSQVKPNDDMSSLKLPSRCCATIYEHGGYRGKKKTFCKSTSFVGAWWNDKTSSVKTFRSLITLRRGDEEEDEEVEDEEVEDEEEEEADEEPIEEEADEEPIEEEADEEPIEDEADEEPIEE